MESTDRYHADCGQCCRVGRCHFCGASGPVAAHFEKGGQRFEIRLCHTHYAWVASHKYAPPIAFDEAFVDDTLPEAVRKSEHFQSTVLALSTR